MLITPSSRCVLQQGIILLLIALHPSHRRIVDAFLPRHSSHQWTRSLLVEASSATSGPDPATKPDYESLSRPLGKPLDDLFLRVFHGKLAERVDPDRPIPSNVTFADVVSLTHHLVRTSSSPTYIQESSQDVLRSLFPSWLPPQFARLFSRPFPEFSAWLNAAVTSVTTTWLMGPSTLHASNNTVTVERCRFLEEAGCISVCVNACQIPTQKFFAEDMGLPLTMEPNYETFECQFAFGKVPPADPAPLAPCLMQCPSAGLYRHGEKKAKIGD